MSKAVVIGAGISGLATACCLAKEGHDVTILEKNDTIGGRARAFSADGFFFDMGPSWYWMPDVFENFFQLFGKSAADYYDLVRLDPGFRIFFRDEPPLDVPADEDALYREFERIEPGSGKKLAEYLDDAGYKYREGMLKLAFKPSISISEYLDPGLLGKMARLKLFTPGSKHIRSYFKDPRLIALMEFPLLFLGGTPQNIPALYSLMNFAALRQGTFYPMGGMYKVVEALSTLADSLGVHVHTGKSVTRLATSNGNVNYVYTEYGCFPSDTVIASGDYAHMETLLDREYRNYSAGYWAGKTFAPSCLIFYIGVNKKIPGLQHHNLFFDADFNRHALQIYDRRQWPSDPLFYVCCPSRTDNSVAPEGCENLFVLMPVATGLGDSNETHEHYYDLLMRRLEGHCGTPIRERVTYKRTYSVTNFMKDYNSYGGNAYGLANTLRQTAILKPRMKNMKLPNLIYTGQLTVPGPGLPPCLISAQIAAKLATQKMQNIPHETLI